MLERKVLRPREGTQVAQDHPLLTRKQAPGKARSETLMVSLPLPPGSLMCFGCGPAHPISRIEQVIRPGQSFQSIPRH